jgi:predicted alpha/beta superfamily hydrolase
MHDGQNLFDPGAMWGGWDVQGNCDAQIAAGAMKPVIVVGAANTPDRFSEYTQVQDDISNTCNGSGLTGGRAGPYAQFLVNELKPAVDGRFRTLTGRDDTGILGSSLGGLVSVWIAWQYPQVFRRVGGMSSTFEWGQICLSNPTMLDVATAAGKLDLVVYIDTGGGPNSSGDNYQPTVQMQQILLGKGWQQGVDFDFYWDQGATHDEAHWRARLWRPLTFLFHP